MGGLEKPEPGSETPEPEKVIEKPDLTTPESLNLWLDKYVPRPFAGFADLKHDDGTSYSPEEQIQATKDQLRKIADEFPKMGKTHEQIQTVLVASVQGLQEVTP